MTEVTITRMSLTNPGLDVTGDWHLGGEKDDTVFFYSKSSENLQFTHLARIGFDGVVMVYEVDEGVSGGKLQLNVNDCSNNNSVCNDFKYLRIFSNRRIFFQGRPAFGEPVPLYINGTFGPPCPPTVVKLGRLD